MIKKTNISAELIEEMLKIAYSVKIMAQTDKNSMNAKLIVPNVKKWQKVFK